MDTTNPLEEVNVFPDRTGLPEWRVEAFYEDGAVEVAIFAGPSAESRARAYAVREYGHRD
jgi:hypothetical protein